MKRLTLLCVLGFVVLIIANTASVAAPSNEKGPRCSDGIDNDGDTLIDGDDPDCGGGSEPPPVCPAEERFPAFLYESEDTRKTQGGTFLAGEDGCRREPLQNPATVHFNDDGGGILVWGEPSSNDEQQEIVYGATFELLPNGDLSVAPPDQLLPFYDEQPQSGDSHIYWSLDVWGNSDHSVVYLAAYRILAQGSPNELRQLLVYTLDTSNGLTVAHRQVIHTTVDTSNPSNVT
jgi:hypothetical protein